MLWPMQVMSYYLDAAKMSPTEVVDATACAWFITRGNEHYIDAPIITPDAWRLGVYALPVALTFDIDYVGDSKMATDAQVLAKHLTLTGMTSRQFYGNYDLIPGYVIIAARAAYDERVPGLTPAQYDAQREAETLVQYSQTNMMP